MNDPITGLPVISIRALAKRLDVEYMEARKWLEARGISTALDFSGHVHYAEVCKALGGVDDTATVAASSTDEATVFSYWMDEKSLTPPTADEIKVFQHKIIAWQVPGEDEYCDRLTRCIAVLGAYRPYNGEGVVEKVYLVNSQGLYTDVGLAEDSRSATEGRPPRSESAVRAEMLTMAVNAWWNHSPAPVAVEKRAQWKAERDKRAASTQRKAA